MRTTSVGGALHTGGGSPWHRPPTSDRVAVVVAKEIVPAVAVAVAVCGCGPLRGDDAGDDGPDVTPPADRCKVRDDGNAVGLCDAKAPPDSFEPVVQWAWTGPGADTGSIVIPLVGNLTDDNADGAIDLCDVPDVVVVASPRPAWDPGHIYVLDGQTGTLHLRIPTEVDSSVIPALGDIDGDGVPEIVTVDHDGRLVAFDHDGTMTVGPGDEWLDPHRIPRSWYSGAIALADLDHDGDVEIIGGNNVWDHRGTRLWSASHRQAQWSATTIADLDGDGFLDVVLGAAAYRHDGTLMWATELTQGFPHVANLDADPEPEVLVTNQDGVTILEHDGTVKYLELRPTGENPGMEWSRPASIHDFDADGRAEFAMGANDYYTVFDADAHIRWSTRVSDASGIACGSAFDFLGDGSAEATYADEHSLFVFGPAGEPLMTTPRTSGTLTEYPVVADIDNDGSAEIVVTSSLLPGAPLTPTVQVIRDREDRWIQARRIWNQHTYHVTNVREDGTIPQFETPSWTQLNTFRTNAQINGAGVCQPPVL